MVWPVRRQNFIWLIRLINLTQRRKDAELMLCILVSGREIIVCWGILDIKQKP
ncbi:MAG: hypothetical protein NHB32_02040 [Fischerella sp. CENA71]|nr:hypothetical protein [Fischerella sp. CENA71]